MKVPVVRTPLSIIALFVSVIELFLAYPVTQLAGNERLILVVFMTAFPFFVAACFFVILWFKPINLYAPKDITPELANRYQPEAAKAAALDIKNKELQEENDRLRARVIPQGAALLAPNTTSEQARVVEQAVRSDLKSLEDQVNAQIKSSGNTDPSAIAKAQRQVQQARLETKEQKVQFIRAEMTKFRDWLATRGFEELPPLPEIVIEPASVLNSYFVAESHLAHFGAAVADDIDTIGHNYFHAVIDKFKVLTKFDGETGALVEGFCDYFPCAYNGDPFLGEKFAATLIKEMGGEAARSAGLDKGWIRNLEDVVKYKPYEEKDSASYPYTMSLVWSGACWELRQKIGVELVVRAVQQTLPQFKATASLAQAARLLKDELVKTAGVSAKEDVRKAFLKRGVKMSAAE